MSKRSGKATLSATATILCRGRRLPIGLSDEGAVLVMGHTPAMVKTLANYAAIGGEPCACQGFAELWRGLTRDAPHTPARLEFTAAVKAYEAAKTAINESRRTINPLADLPMHQRPEFLAPFIGRMLRDHCGFPRDIKLTIRSLGDPWAYQFRLAKGKSSVLNARIASSWADDVFRKGLAVVEGVLTLRTISYKYGAARRGGYRIERIVIGNAGGAVSFALRRANVLPTEDGVFRVV